MTMLMSKRFKHIIKQILLSILVAFVLNAFCDLVSFRKEASKLLDNIATTNKIVIAQQQKENATITTIKLGTVIDGNQNQKYTNISKYQLSNQNQIRQQINYNIQQSNSFAYAFLLGGCDPTSNPFYREFLWGILVAIHILQNEGSTADMIVMISMSPDATTNTLPKHEEQYLRQYNCVIKYLTTTTTTTANSSSSLTFHDVQMLKFHMLQYTNYDRILYLDSDVMPLCNLDYLFTMSMQGQLRHNVVIAWTKEPSNGGFFMLEPNINDFEELQKIIQITQNNKTLQQKKDDDKLIGWGNHVFQFPYGWCNWNKEKCSTKWDFYAADSDQGLLYYWVRHVKQDVSIIMCNSVMHWTANNTLSITESAIKLFEPFTPLHPRENLINITNTTNKGWMAHPTYNFGLAAIYPYNNFIHFYGEFKPWKRLTKPIQRYLPNKYNAHGSTQFWFQNLYEVNETLQMGLDLQHWNETYASLTRPKAKY